MGECTLPARSVATTRRAYCGSVSPHFCTASDSAMPSFVFTPNDDSDDVRREHRRGMDAWAHSSKPPQCRGIRQSTRTRYVASHTWPRGAPQPYLCITVCEGGESSYRRHVHVRVSVQQLRHEDVEHFVDALHQRCHSPPTHVSTPPRRCDRVTTSASYTVTLCVLTRMLLSDQGG